MDSNSSIINVNYLKTGQQYLKTNEKQFIDEDISKSKSKSKYLRLEEFYNNGLINNSHKLFPKTPPAPTTRNPPNPIKDSQEVYKPSTGASTYDLGLGGISTTMRRSLN